MSNEFTLTDYVLRDGPLGRVPCVCEKEPKAVFVKTRSSKPTAVMLKYVSAAFFLPLPAYLYKKLTSSKIVTGRSM